MNDSDIAHLGMIQGVISRMASNSFALKALAMTLASAVLAFVGSVADPKWMYPLAGMLPQLAFWYLDAKYLRLERLYRRLYDEVRTGQLATPFSMDTSAYRDEISSTFRIAFSWSVFGFYLFTLVALLLSFFALLGCF